MNEETKPRAELNIAFRYYGELAERIKYEAEKAGLSANNYIKALVAETLRVREKN